MKTETQTDVLEPGMYELRIKGELEKPDNSLILSYLVHELSFQRSILVSSRWVNNERTGRATDWIGLFRASIALSDSTAYVANELLPLAHKCAPDLVTILISKIAARGDGLGLWRDLEL